MLEADDKSLVCRVCREENVLNLLDLGKQPFCNRFLRSKDEEEDTYHLQLGQCKKCSVVQLIDPPPYSDIVPRGEEIRYTEPEKHLDDMVETIAKLPGVTEDSRVMGVSYKEDSALERFRNQGFVNTFRLDIGADLGIENRNAGIESIQDALTPRKANEIAAQKNKADVVIARHILEHSHNPLGFLDALKNLVKEKGYIVLEVPDCSDSLKMSDYTMIWEEHILSFTPQSFQAVLKNEGLRVVRHKIYSYNYENSLVGIVQPHATRADSYKRNDEDFELGAAFAQNFRIEKDKVGAFFRRYCEKGRKIAVFGSGHLSAMYINLMGIGKEMQFVVNDNPKKQGLYMPGSKLPIVGSQRLLEDNINLCLLGLSPESEAKVVNARQDFRNAGGKFASILKKSKYCLQYD